MKTTFDLPEELLHRAKIAAAQRKVTLKDLVVRGLESQLRSVSLLSDEQRKARLRRLLRKMKGSNTEPIVPLTRDEIYDR